MNSRNTKRSASKWVSRTSSRALWCAPLITLLSRKPPRTVDSFRQLPIHCPSGRRVESGCFNAFLAPFLRAGSRLARLIRTAILQKKRRHSERSQESLLLFRAIIKTVEGFLADFLPVPSGTRNDGQWGFSSGRLNVPPDQNHMNPY